MNSVPATPPTRTLRLFAGIARALLWLVLSAWVLFALTWGLLHGLIVPRIGNWRPELETVASHALGVPVTVGDIRAASTGPIPSFELRDVRLHDSGGREALHLQRVLVALSVQSLWRLGFEQLVIDGPMLDVRRFASGRITVAGLDLSTGTADQASALGDWFFDQKEFVIRQGKVRWTDEQRPQAPTLELKDLDLVVRNSGQQHRLRLDATPPAEWGDRFSMRGLFRQPPWSFRHSDWHRWNGQAYGHFPRISLQQLQQHLDTRDLLGLQMQDGLGALRLWLDVKEGQATAVTTDAALNKVELQMRPDLQPLALDDLSGRVRVQNEGLRLNIATQNLSFRTREGQVWPGGNFRFEKTSTRQGEVQAMGLQADRLDLSALRQISLHLPLGNEVQHWLQELQPAGVVETLAANWNADSAGAQTTAARWNVKGRVEGLALAAPRQPPAGDSAPTSPGRPGIEGASLSFDANETGGKADLALRNGHLEFPGVFEEPRIGLQRLEAQFQWKLQGDRIEIHIPRARFANADAAGEAKGSWHTGDTATARFPGVLDLSATLDRANANRVHRYLPMGIPANVRHYLREAVTRGQANDARFKVKGDLRHFPFDRSGPGEFSIRAKLADIDYQYVPDTLATGKGRAWPGLLALNTQFSIDRGVMRFSQGKAGVAQSPALRLTQIEARFDDYLHAPELQAQARVQGLAEQALGFVNRSPLGDMTGQALNQASISGSSDIQFRLNLPLANPDATRVTGQVLFADNDIQINPQTPRLEHTSGRLNFTEKGFNIPQASSRLFGGELKFEGGMSTVRNETLLEFTGQGTASAEGLKQQPVGMADFARLASFTSGSTSYKVRLGFRHGHTEMEVSSGLQGMEVKLPRPLGKTAQTTLPVRYGVTLIPPAQPGQAWRDQIEFQAGAPSAPVLSARYERQLGSAEPVVLRGALSLSSTPADHVLPALPEQGVHAHAVVEEVDLDTWERLFSTPTPSGSLPAAGSSRTTEGNMAYWPTVFALRAQKIMHDGRSFHQVVAGGTRDRDIWRANVDARELNGYLEYRDGGQGKIFARLARLTLPPSTAREVETFLQQPSDIPALDIVVGDFELQGRSLGRLEIEAVHRNPALTFREMAGEWRLNKLNLTVPEAQLQASGNWVLLGAQSRAVGAAPAQRRTALSIKLDIRDSGALLARFGMPDVIREGKGQLTGTVGWLGSPLKLHYPSLDGQLNLALERGQFLKADPGLAKLLGVLSLQALPRRLALDFRDVFSEGFAFDFVRGDARIVQGVVSTNNLQMKGVNAAVMLEGSADLAKETQDITAVVVPELGPGTGSLLSTLINPAVGLGSFLAQFLLRQPLQEAATQQFHITGSWIDPKVEKVSRQSVTREAPREGNTP